MRWIALGIWSLALPAGAASLLAVAALSPAHREAALIGLAVAPLAWTGVVGGVVCPPGRWRDVPVALSAGVAGLLTALFVTYLIGLAMNDCSTAGAQASTCTDDHAASVGMLLGALCGALLWLTMIPFGFVAAIARNRLAHVRRSRQ